MLKLHLPNTFPLAQLGTLCSSYIFIILLSNISLVLNITVSKELFGTSKVARCLSKLILNINVICAFLSNI